MPTKRTDVTHILNFAWNFHGIRRARAGRLFPLLEPTLKSILKCHSSLHHNVSLEQKITEPTICGHVAEQEEPAVDSACCLLIRQGAQAYKNSLAKALKLVVTPALPKKNGFKAIGGVSHV